MEKIIGILFCVIIIYFLYHIIDESKNYDINKFYYAFGKKEYKKAIKIARKLCDDGHMAACSYLGLFYSVGEGVEKDYNTAFKLFKKSCNGGDYFMGCLFLADEYYKGEVANKDVRMATSLHEKTCSAGNNVACTRLKIIKENCEIAK